MYYCDVNRKDHFRFKRMSFLTWTQILYFAQYKLAPYDLECGIFTKICWASKTLEEWVQIFIEFELYSIDDYSDYIRLEVKDKLPKITQDLFVEVMETIITLEYCIITEIEH